MEADSATVTPAKAGVQLWRRFMQLDSGFRRNDDVIGFLPGAQRPPRTAM
jgi:hypothetical protein